MINRLPLSVPAGLIAVSLTLTGCELAKGIFKAGVWVGVLAVVGVIALALFGIKKLMS